MLGKQVLTIFLCIKRLRLIWNFIVNDVQSATYFSHGTPSPARDLFQWLNTRVKVHISLWTLREYPKRHFRYLSDSGDTFLPLHWSKIKVATSFGEEEENLFVTIQFLTKMNSSKTFELKYYKYYILINCYYTVSRSMINAICFNAVTPHCTELNIDSLQIYLRYHRQSNKIRQHTDDGDEDLTMAPESMWVFVYQGCDKTFHCTKLTKGNV